MKLLKNNQIHIKQWELLLQKSPFASPFQTSYFYNLLSQIPGYYATVYAIAEDEDINALCIITIQKERGIKGYFSRRAIVYGGPILYDKSDKYLEFLVQSILKDLRRRTIYFEIRNYFDYKFCNHIYQISGFQWLPYLNVRLNLTGRSIDEVLSSMKYNRRREIKMSLEGDAYYREAENSSEVEQLYGILQKLYRTKVKLPLPDLIFFETLFRSPIGKTFVVIHNNMIIGGAFCLFSENSGIYTMYYCGLRDYDKKIFPTHLGILAAIDFGIKNNHTFIDFMGAGRNDEEYGVRKYKQEFGGELVEFGRYLKINNRLLYFIGRYGLKLMRKKGK